MVVGASAGVAIAAMQIAKWRGAKIYAATSSPEKADKIKAIGADDVFIAKEGQEMSRWIHKRTDGRGVDVVFEHVGPVTWEQSVKSLSKYGRLVTCGATTGPSANLDLRYVFSRDLTLMGARMGTQKEFLQLSQVVFDGHIKPVIDKKFPLGCAAQAHTYLERKEQIGKVILET
jgi:NADPH:quinone reductase-like Zn-dependent oxidoreductase